MALQLFKIASVEVATPQASIDFSSIPSGYTDLMLVLSVRTARANVSSSLGIRFNSDSGNNYTNILLQGDGSATSSVSSGATSRIVYFYAPGSTATTNAFANGQVYIPNYTSSNYKSLSTDGVVENNGTTGTNAFAAGLWSSTSAITSISISEPFGSTNFVADSTATLYGVL